MRKNGLKGGMLMVCHQKIKSPRKGVTYVGVVRKNWQGVLSHLHHTNRYRKPFFSFILFDLREG